MDFDLDAYLKRVGLDGQSPSLHQLHRAHVTTVPFENLDPLRGVPVSLELTELQAKLVTARRGGYCFEQNSLLSAGLRALGVQVEPMLARVGDRHNPERPLSHLLLRVTEHGQAWHADVGFGMGTLVEPIPFGPGGPYRRQGWQWRVIEHGRELALQSTGPDGEWSDLYSFVPEPVPLVDIVTANWARATHPASRFVRGLVVSVQADDGTRTALSDWSGTLRLRTERPDGETSADVDRSEIPDLLAHRFGLPGWILDDQGRPVPAV